MIYIYKIYFYLFYTFLADMSAKGGGPFSAKKMLAFVEGGNNDFEKKIFIFQ